jgi:hypothetical protein
MFIEFEITGRLKMVTLNSDFVSSIFPSGDYTTIQMTGLEDDCWEVKRPYSSVKQMFLEIGVDTDV